MHSTIKASLLLFCAFWFAAPGYSQSLGDVARQTKQQQQAKGTEHKVITDDDLPNHTDSSISADKTAVVGNKRSDSIKGNSADKTQRGEQLKNAIRAQKSAIASMQSQIDKVNASVHYVEANRYSNGVQYNQYQAKKQEEAQRMQSYLDEQKKKLEEMQESARREGFGSAVYDP